MTTTRACQFTVLAALLLGAWLAGGSPSARAAPTIPKERISDTIPPDVRRRIEEMYSRDAVTRGMGAVYLARMGDRAEAAIPFLIAMLGDDAQLEWPAPRETDNPLDEFKKRLTGIYKERETSPGAEAAKALTRLCGKAPAGLVAALKDPTTHVRVNAVKALGGIRDRKTLDPLVLCLQDGEKDVRLQAAIALGRLGDTEATEPLLAALKDLDRYVRKEAVVALGELHDPRALQPLLEALNDVVDVSDAAAKVLLENRDPRAVEPLIEALRGRKPEVQRLAARILGAIGSRSAYRPLIGALRDPATDVRFEASAALRRMSGEDFGPDPERWQRWWELDSAEREVEESVAADPYHAYIAALHHPEWAYRAYGAKALGQRRDRRAVPSLCGVLWDKDAGVRRAAATALGQIGAPRAVDSLIAAVSDAEPEVQEAAEFALRLNTGANNGRDTRKWQDWWEQNKQLVLDTYRLKVNDKGIDEETRINIEEAPVVKSGTGGMTLLIVLGLIVVLPLATLLVVRMARSR